MSRKRSRTRVLALWAWCPHLHQKPSLCSVDERRDHHDRVRQDRMRKSSSEADILLASRCPSCCVSERPDSGTVRSVLPASCAWSGDNLMTSRECQVSYVCTSWQSGVKLMCCALTQLLVVRSKIVLTMTSKTCDAV